MGSHRALCLLLVTASSVVTAPGCAREVGYVELVGDPQLRSECVVLFAQPAGEEAKQTDGARWKDRRARFAVAMTKPTDVVIWARGFGPDCAAATEPAEESVQTLLVRGKVVQLSLEVVGKSAPDGGGGGDAGVDADGDGAPAGLDCADDDPRRAPGRPELCGNALDDDCDTLVDCADAQCAGQPCDDRLTCTPASACTAGRCEATQACAPTTDGGCFEHCAIDGGCAWRARTGGACDDGQRCTYGDTCTSLGTCAPSMICMDSNDCTAEVCAATMCAQSVIRYAPCGDGGACNAAGQCVDGGFRLPVSNLDVDTLVGWRTRSVTSSCSGTATLDTGTGSVTVDSSCLAGLALNQHQLVPQASGRAPLYVVATEGGLTLPSGVLLRAVGPNPLVFVVRGAVSIAGRISVSASGATPGAGAPSCGVGLGGAVPDVNLPQGGGGGGGFGLPGGRGSWWDGGWTPGGQVEGEDSLVPLRGGCAGGSVARSSPVAGGAGGGALQISASTELVLQGPGRLTAGGGGGGTYLAMPGQTPNSGGGGGGSGGAILLEAPSIRLQSGSVVAANGGGGGQGRQQSLGDAGANALDDTLPAPGGCGGSACGKCGGNGGARFDSARDGSDAGTFSSCTPPIGGGGGGGGVGRIRLNATACQLGATLSPSPSSDTASCR